MSGSLTSVEYFCTYLFYKIPNCPFFLFDAVVAVAPMAGYIDLIFKVKKVKSAISINKDSAIIFLVSNMMRLIYFYGERYAMYLFWQALVTVVVQYILCFLSYRYKKSENMVGDGSIVVSKSHQAQPMFSCHPFAVNTFLGFNIISLLIIGIFIGFTAFFSVMIGLKITMNSIGLISSLMDSIVTFPQFINAVFLQNITYITPMLLFQWISGTLFKLFLFFFRPTPWPFRVGASVQAFLVFSITAQFIRMKYCINQEDDSDSEASDSQDIHVDLLDDDSSKETGTEIFMSVEDQKKAQIQNNLQDVKLEMKDENNNNELNNSDREINNNNNNNIDNNDDFNNNDNEINNNDSERTEDHDAHDTIPRKIRGSTSINSIKCDDSQEMIEIIGVQ